MSPEEINTGNPVMFCGKSNLANTQDKDFKTTIGSMFNMGMER